MILQTSGSDRFHDADVMTDENKIWPPPPKQERQTLSKGVDAHSATMRVMGIGSVCVSLFGLLVSVGSQNLYVVMGAMPYLIMRFVSGCILCAGLALGISSWRLWPGKIGICMSSIALVSVLVDVINCVTHK